MKQTNRVLAILLALTLCLSMAACGSQTASPVSQNEPESEAAVTESSAEEAPEPVSEEAAPDSSEPQEAPEEPTAETAAEGLAARSHVTAQMGVPTVILNNGVEMPRLGLGTQIQSLEQDASEEGRKLLGDTSHDAVVAALQAGYRHLDTAHGYYNERGVGQGILDSGVPREEIWLTSKLWPSEYGEGVTMQAIDDMLERLQTDYIDLIYLHHPAGDYEELAEKREAERIRLEQLRKKREEKTIQDFYDRFPGPDDNFYLIAGYTPGGAPYGVTWEEMGLEPWTLPEDL